MRISTFNENDIANAKPGKQLLKFMISAACLLIATPALADIKVEFRESAPKDSFTISNTSDCAVRDVTLTIDLSTSPSGLIFDTTSQGAGVEVFQPFELIQGQDLVTGIPIVTDGQNAINLEINNLRRAQSIRFTIDIDDTTGNRETMVQGSEIKGASIRVGEIAAEFDETALAQLPYSGCPS